MFRTLAALTMALLTATSTTAFAQSDVADFYRGKTVRLIIGYGPGGGYDVYGKFFARYLGEHIPGNPTVIPQNMPGAGSRSAANWLYKVAPKDGTVLAVLSQATPADQALGQPGIQFDVRNFNWIGNMVAVNNIMITWAESGVRTIDDAKKKVIAIGATGASSPSVIYPTVANNLFGTQFKIVSGYPGGGDIMIALERREVDGRVDGFRCFLEARVGFGTADVIIRQRAVANAAAKVRPLVQRDQFLVVGHRRFVQLINTCALGEAGKR
jgi:tripartite-type tricarboxylate transporter receptor subunit TctC